MSHFDIPELKENRSAMPAAEHDVRRQLAPLYAVIIHDDSVTTMEFVVDILVTLFGYDKQRAFETMYLIHTTGQQKVATLPLERAEMSVIQVRRQAQTQKFPLSCTIEPE